MDQDPKTLDPAAWVAWAQALIETGRFVFKTARPTGAYPNGRNIRNFRPAGSYEEQGCVFWTCRRRWTSGGRFFPAKWAQSVRLWEQSPGGAWVRRSPDELADLPPAWIFENVPGSAA